jgi:hypothetical protein
MYCGYLQSSDDGVQGAVDIVVVHTEFGAFYYSMDGTSGDTNVSADANGFNIMAVGCEWGPAEKDAGLVLAETDRVLIPAMDGEFAKELVVRGSVKWYRVPGL